MRYLIILTLLIAACTSKKEPNNVNVVGLKAELTDTKELLSLCQAQLRAHHSDSNKPSEDLKISQPEYETVSRYDIETKFGRTSCYERNGGNAGDDQDLDCGMTFSDCKDGYVYRCLTDVKYKIVEEQKLVEE